MDVKHRVNGSMLDSHMGQEVIVVGKVLSNDGKKLMLEMSDGHNVAVTFYDVTEAMQGSLVEINARINPDRSLNGMNLTAFSENFNLSQYNEAIMLVKKYPDHFTPPISSGAGS